MMMKDSTALLNIRNSLRGTCSRPFSLLTISFHQSAVLAAPDGVAVPPPAHPAPSRVGSEPLPDPDRREALRLIAMFEQQRRPGRNFAVDGLNGRFVSKHEYLSALRFAAKGGA